MVAETIRWFIKSAKYRTFRIFLSKEIHSLSYRLIGEYLFIESLFVPNCPFVSPALQTASFRGKCTISFVVLDEFFDLRIFMDRDSGWGGGVKGEAPWPMRRRSDSAHLHLTAPFAAAQRLRENYHWGDCRSLATVSLPPGSCQGRWMIDVSGVYEALRPAELSGDGRVAPITWSHLKRHEWQWAFCSLVSLRPNTLIDSLLFLYAAVWHQNLQQGKHIRKRLLMQKPIPLFCNFVVLKLGSV